MNCNTYRTEIEECGADVELSGRAQAHLFQCRDCRKLHADNVALRRLIGSLSAVGAPDDFDFRLRAGMASAKNASGKRVFVNYAGFAPGAVSIALTACFVLTLAVILLRPVVRVSDASGDNSTPVKQGAMPAPQVTTADDPQLAAIRQAGDTGPTHDSRFGMKRKNHSRRRAIAGMTRSPLINRRDEESFDSDSFSLRAAPVISIGASFAVPVGTATQFVRIKLMDERCVVRVVAIEPVSFGAQGLAGGLTDRARLSSADSEGLW